MSSLDVHRRVKKAVQEIEETHGAICTNIEVIAEYANTDTRTAKKHLAIMEEDELGKFCDPKQKTYASNNRLSKTK